MTEPTRPAVNDRMKEIALAVPMLDLLDDCGVEVDLQRDGPQQIACPFHGDGRDITGSARYYPDSNGVKCWGCGKWYDPIEWVKAHHGVSFPEAVELLCREYSDVDLARVRPRKKGAPVGADAGGQSVIAVLEADARRLWPQMQLGDKVLMSQVFDRLWALGCPPAAQTKVTEFLQKVVTRTTAS